MSYTEGEWKIHAPERGYEDRIKITSPINNAGYYEFVCFVHGHTTHEIRLANANLISAAPDMYEGLKKAIIAMASMYRLQEYTEPQIEEELKIFKPALAKAEGRE